MAHSESLRVIGQWLEAANIRTFELKTDGPNYIVTCEPLTQNGGWVPHEFSPSDFTAQAPRQPVVPAPYGSGCRIFFDLRRRRTAKTTKFFSN